MWHSAGVSEHLNDNIMIEKYNAEVLNFALKRVMHAIQTQQNKAQQDVVHCMIHITKLWTIRKWSKSKTTIEKPSLWLWIDNADLIDLKQTEEDQAQWMTLGERYTLHGTAAAWRIHRWSLVCFFIVLGDTNNHNTLLKQWYDEGLLDAMVDYPIFQGLIVTFLPMLIFEPVEYTEPDQDKTSSEVLLHEPELHKNSLLQSSHGWKPVHFCPLPSLVQQ